MLMEVGMELSLFTMDDYDAVFALWQNTPGMGLNSIDDSREGIARYLQRNPATCFVAKEGNALAGVILSGHDGRRGFIYHLAVAAGFRRRGVGRLLAERAAEALKAEGIAKVALVVMAKNELGNRFWESIGFHERKDLVYRDKVITDKTMRRMDT